MGQGTVRLQDGRDLYYVSRPGPDDRPLVLLEAGLGGGRSHWHLVQRELAGELASVAYDRSGIGRSPAARGRRDLARLAADLNEFLDRLPGPERPVILVGHSWGGPIVRVAAAARPDRVAGLVLVDPADEACDQYFTPTARRMRWAGLARAGSIARNGLGMASLRGVFALLPDDAAREMREESFTPTATRAFRAELRCFEAGLHELRADPPDLKNLPLTVISAGLTSAGINTTMLAALQAAHRRRAETSGGKQIFAESSGHLVPLLQPELVAEQIHAYGRSWEPERAGSGPAPVTFPDVDENVSGP